MADSILVFNQKNTAPDTIEVFYTAPNNVTGVRVKAFTASNDVGSSRSYKAYIYSSSGTAVDAIIPQTIVVKDKSDFGAPIINQLIPPGGTLRMESSSPDGTYLNFYVTGVIQT
jgi:hypothetical protein